MPTDTQAAATEMPSAAAFRSTRDILKRVKQFIPPLLESMHKGQQGRVAVVGGSEDYTGAPFFSANASALLGADLSHVICEPQAAAVIKTYSPNLMVHPYMRQSHHKDSVTNDAGDVVERVAGLLDRMHAVVIGPGLGRDELMLEAAEGIVGECKKKGLPFVLDADGLQLVQKDPKIVEGYTDAILTPNVVEFGRLCKALNIDPSSSSPGDVCGKLATALGGVTIIQKGPKDYISNGSYTLICDVEGGLKRSGGQGDTLTGSLATFLAWRRAYLDGVWEHDNSLTTSELLQLSAFGASAITRTCSKLAFQKKGRALQALDLSLEVPQAFELLFGGDEPKL